MNDPAPAADGVKPVTAAEITPQGMPEPTVPAPKSTQGGEVPLGQHSPGPAGSTPAPAPTGEIDKAGTVFDPSKHNHRTHPLTGIWMPRGGRKPAGAPAAGAPPGESSAPPSFIPPEEPPAAAPAVESAPAAVAPVQGPDSSTAAGDMGSRAVQFTAGLVLRAPAECTASAGEHKQISEAITAYIRGRGWHLGPGLGLVVILGAWVLKVLQQPKPWATVSRWLGFDRVAAARDVTPDDARPAGSAGPPPSGQTVDLPARFPPLAKS